MNTPLILRHADQMTGSVSAICYNTLMTTKWTKYTFVCNSECDALIEYTLKAGYTFNNESTFKCVCGSPTTVVSVVDATIDPMEKKEEKVDTIQDTYNPNLLITYKTIVNGNVEFVTDKVSDIEWSLKNAREDRKANEAMANRTNLLENMLSSYCQDNSDADMELITEIAEIFNIRLTKDITFTATINVSGTMTVDLTDETDLETMLTENLSVDAYSGDIEISNYSVDEVSEDY